MPCGQSDVIQDVATIILFLVDRPYETFANRPLLPNFCVPDERDLSTGSNFNPQNTQCIPACPVGPRGKPGQAGRSYWGG